MFNELVKFFSKNKKDIRKTKPVDEFDLQAPFFTLKVFSGIGGTAIQYSKYNEDIDEVVFHLHIISEKEELGEAISKIITFETLRS